MASAADALGTVDELADAARTQTGLDDLGADTWVEGLSVLIDSVAREARPSDMGVAIFRAQASQFLTNRLEINDWYRRHPEIDDEVVELPVFSIGMVRTGTTALSYLLDQDPDNRSLLHWFAMHPSPPPETAHLGDDPRIALTETQMGLTGMTSSDKSMMELLPDGPCECLHLLGLDFRSGHFEGMYNVPSYHRWLFAADLTPAYQWHKRALKLLQWRAPTKRWMLKYPSHTMALDPLFDTYPNARFVVTHRDPVRSITSVCSLVGSGAVQFTDHSDDAYLGRQWTVIVEEQLRRMIAFRERVGDECFFDIDHLELVREPLATLERLYDWLGAEITPAARRGFEERIASNPKGVYGTHRYDPETYGLRPDEIRERFAFYTERFGVTSEA
jgi:Sulfotransferase family